jgi:hypothetical protein
VPRTVLCPPSVQIQDQQHLQLTFYWVPAVEVWGQGDGKAGGHLQQVHQDYVQPPLGNSQELDGASDRSTPYQENTCLKKLLNLVMTDVRTTTGSNLRSIMLLAGKNTIQEVLSSKIDVDYHKLEEEQNWKSILLGEIIEILHDEKTIGGLETQELEDTLEFLCIG